MPLKYNKTTYRNGATSSQHVVPTEDDSAEGNYTCSVTISSIPSAASPLYSVTAIGLFFDMI